MAYSDADAEAEVEDSFLCVSNYHLEDDDDMPVSFSVLPIQWSESEDSGAVKGQVFLHGFADNGLQKILFHVTAWRFDLSNVKPEISLLSKDRRWIKLQKPRKSFEATIRTILITIHFLHRLKKNPRISSKSVWDNLCEDKELSTYKVKPSQNDLLNHMPLIREAAKRDAVLAKSKLLLTILEEHTGNKKLSDEEVKNLERPGIIVDDIDNDMLYETNEESEAEDDLFCSVCALCDNGGDLVCCDGACMRSFHATKETGRDSMCDSLGFTQKEVDKIQIFYCKNCQYNQHQCFACGKLGSSGQAKGAEVIKCACATCDHFYHPHCVAELLPQVVKHVAEELERNIADGDRFTCPVHYCCVCKELENKTDPELQFAICRRCPKSYHRKCLPREIAFEDTDDEDIIPRAWEGLLPNNRILIYCLNHEIDDELGTPIRDHIKFPGFKATAREINTTKEKMKPATKERVISNKNNVDLDNSSDKSTAKGSKVTGKLSSGKVGSKKSENIISGSNISRKPKAKETSRRRSIENKRSISKKFEMPDCEENLPLCTLMNKASVRTKPDNQVKPTRKLSSALPPLDADSERSLSALLKEARSSIKLDSVIEKQKIASTHTHSLRKVVEEAITMGKLEGSVDAVRTALRKLEGGCSIQDVEAVCNRDVLKQIFKWKDKLKVYLAPVLYGNRYTSYGRHFTHVKKLEGIVDKLHWYVQNGDTIVDFCCGANDFSILMKKKLEETGKKCSYKNYDLLPTKNDFSFEMRDWMTVNPNELPTGSQLIMGLNPPVGAKAALANKFIDKALEFKPKLLILIVPQETERLDKKQSSYDLVWEDENFLSGMSFYLPGSVDVNDKQLDQWNIRPPLLSLWSRRDWTTKHLVIAQEHGHMSCQHEVLKMESFNTEMLPADHTRDDNYGDNLMPSHVLLKSTDDQEDQASVNEGKKSSSNHGNVDQESKEVPEYMMSKSGKTSRKRKHIEENDRRGLGLVSRAKRQAVNEMIEGLPDHSQPNPIDEKSSVEGFQPTPVMACPNVEVGDNGCLHLEPVSESGTTNSRIEKGASSVVTNIEEHDSREEEKHQRESGVRQRDHMGYSHAQLDSATESSYRMKTPAMERHAPHLDELKQNHVRMGSLGSEPLTVSRSGTFEHRVPQPGYGDGLLGFASGPHHAYSRRYSAGWLDE